MMVYSTVRRNSQNGAGLGAQAHLLLPWMWDLIHHPAIVDAVEAVLGTGVRALAPTAVESLFSPIE